MNEFIQSAYLSQRIMNLSVQDIRSWPKVELHLHLDCSLSFTAVQKLDPSISLSQYRSEFIAPGKCPDLNAYIEKASSSIRLMQTKSQLELVTKDLYDQLEKDNVVYAEIRFAPLLHTEQGLSPEEVVETVVKVARQQQTQKNIPGGIILCTLRHFTEDQGMETIRLVEKYLDQGVVGFDIASDEAGYPIDQHVNAFQYAKSRNIPCTAHAGEAKGADSVWETLLNFHPQRIGHGVRSEEDPKLLDYLLDKGIHLEICPTSNIQTNIFPDLTYHNVDRLFRKGLSLSINTDGRTISNTTCTTEYLRLAETFQWVKAHFYKCNMEAIGSAFTTPAVKDAVSKILEDRYSNDIGVD